MANIGARSSKTGNPFTCTPRLHQEVFNRVSMQNIVLLKELQRVDWSFICTKLTAEHSVGRSSQHPSPIDLQFYILCYAITFNKCSKYYY